MNNEKLVTADLTIIRFLLKFSIPLLEFYVECFLMYSVEQYVNKDCNCCLLNKMQTNIDLQHDAGTYERNRNEFKHL